MARQPLFEYISPVATNALATIEESINTVTNQPAKHLYLKGICIQGDIRNANQRIYPAHEIRRAVENMQRIIKENNGISGELDHPDNLTVNLDRISHNIVECWIEGNDGYGKLKVLNTPMGNIARTLSEEGIKLGVSSRGSGNVNESTGYVSDFEIVTIDLVSAPSAPNAYPKPIYEGLMNFRGGNQMFEIARFAHEDKAAQKYIQSQLTNFIRDLRLQ